MDENLASQTASNQRALEIIGRLHQAILQLVRERDAAVNASRRLAAENRDLQNKIKAEHNNYVDAMEMSVMANEHFIGALYPGVQHIQPPVAAAPVNMTASASVSHPNLAVRRKPNSPPDERRRRDGEEHAIPSTITGLPTGLMAVPIAVAQARMGVVSAADHGNPSGTSNQATVSNLAHLAENNQSSTSLRDRLRRRPAVTPAHGPINKANISAPVAESFVASPLSLAATIKQADEKNDKEDGKKADKKADKKTKKVLHRVFGRLHHKKA